MFWKKRFPDKSLRTVKIIDEIYIDKSFAMS